MHSTPRWQFVLYLAGTVALTIACLAVARRQAPDPGRATATQVVHFPADWKAGDKRPAIVFFFGGGWSKGSVGQFEDQARHLASRGMVAARADYRVKSRDNVTPEACVADAQDALRYLSEHADELGIDRDKIVAAGGSAGGHLAACTSLSPAIEPRNTELPRPVALVLYNPVVRFEGEPRLMSRIDDNEELGRKLSPVLWLKKDSPPALLLYGTKDQLKAQGDEFVELAKKLQLRAEMYSAEGQGHGFFNRSPWKERTSQRVDEFLTSLGLLEAASKSADQGK